MGHELLLLVVNSSWIKPLCHVLWAFTWKDLFVSWACNGMFFPVTAVLLHCVTLSLGSPCTRARQRETFPKYCMPNREDFLSWGGFFLLVMNLSSSFSLLPLLLLNGPWTLNPYLFLYLCVFMYLVPVPYLHVLTSLKMVNRVPHYTCQQHK